MPLKTVSRTSGGGGGSGTVTDVNVSGGTTGLTTSGGPITTTGTITLGGVLDIDNGGTGNTIATAAFDALAPTTTKGDLIVYNGSDNIRLGVGTNGYYLKADSTTGSGLAWDSVAAGGVTNVTASPPIASSGGSTPNISLTGIVPIANGGTGETTDVAAFDALAPTTTKGDIIVYDGTDNIRLGVGAHNYVLTADSLSASGLNWASVSGGGSGTTTYAATFNNSGTGDASGTAFNGSVARTISYNTLGAPKTDGTNATGTWGISISGNAATATSATSAGSATTAGSVTNSVTFNTTGGAAAGTTYNGSVARTIDYSTVGAPKADGTGASGTWSINISGSAGSASTATTATNLAGGLANQLAYQTGAGATSFVTAASGTNTFLKWSGSAFSWSTVAEMAYPGAGIANSTGSAWGTSYTTTGTGTVVALSTSPSFTTPSLGVATATSVNKVTITAPATGSTLTIADGKTATINNTLTLAGTDATTMTFPATSTTVAGLGIAQTFTQDQTIAGNLTLNAQGDVRFADGDSSNWVAFQGPATVTSNVTWTLPSTDGSSGQFLSTNGSGTLSWATGGGGGGSSVILENQRTISSNYTVTDGYNGSSVGPVTINTGVAVTVGTDQRWLIFG